MADDQPDIRPGETTLGFDPGAHTDATLRFIGRIHTPWQRGDCPKNVTSARERAAAEGGQFTVKLDEGFAPGLIGLEPGRGIFLIYWMHRARRDLITQAPRHAQYARGTFSLRSPNRPNPLAMSAVTITSLDPETGEIGIDAIDCFDGTPLVDIKPWTAGVDTPVPLAEG
ncbi:TrmO family methyltransferase [Shimia sp.]|uniref:SAM-dependent methyltransferase n=1 Tax=Shimia sp. TaxID=1954381 RepID=UPI003297C4A7